MQLEDIFKLYESDLKVVEERLHEIFFSPVFSIPLIGKYILEGGGKRLRPLVLLLSAEIAGCRSDARLTLAGIIESIHTASLLHDDVVDGADIRRGKVPAHALWGNQLVILVGDYLYSNALRLAVLQKSQKIMEALSGATTSMTEAEVLQLSRTGNPDITEDEYMNIISGKTAALISAACRIGAVLGALPEDREDALTRFGLKTGIAFQMADDILDYMAEEAELGKKLGKDLKEGKITLPLIYLLKEANEQEQGEIKDIIVNGCKKRGMTRILNLFKRYNSIGLSLARAQDFIASAKGELSLFQDSPAKNALQRVADYALLRRK
jgi:octaprenyl-diphosphate synthase